MNQAITLTTDQKNAQDAFMQFVMDPIESVFVLSGFSGTGKSTLVKTLLDDLPNIFKASKLINPDTVDYTVELTATTNKAAESFSHVTGMDVRTIHSFLGLRVSTDYSTNTTRLIPKDNTPQEGLLLFIDEASYVDRNLLEYIFKLTARSKVVFIGDPAQLTPVKSNNTPVFDAKFTGAHLSQVVRQAEGNPIIDLSTKFRLTVSSGEFFQFKPDGEAVIHLPRKEFNEAMLAEFGRPDWRYQDSKFLAWTNKCTIDHNHAIRDKVLGDPHFQVNDYAVCNKFMASRRSSIKTDQLVQITRIDGGAVSHGVAGKYYTIDRADTFFGADSLPATKTLLKNATASGHINIVEEVNSKWIDLRAAYACTVNKSQGSTFDRVFIDLDDISKCNNGEQIARMLYVAISRARKQVFLTGDFT